MSQKTFTIFDANIGKPTLPNLACVSELFLHPIRKSAFDKLHGLFNRNSLIDCDEQMHMIRHNDKIMHSELAPSGIEAQHINKQGRMPLGLQ